MTKIFQKAQAGRTEFQNCLPERDGDLLRGRVVLHCALPVQDVARTVVFLPLGDVWRWRQQLKCDDKLWRIPKLNDISDKSNKQVTINKKEAGNGPLKNHTKHDLVRLVLAHDRDWHCRCGHVNIQNATNLQIIHWWLMTIVGLNVASQQGSINDSVKTCFGVLV